MIQTRIPFLDLTAINARFELDFEDAFKRVRRGGSWVLGPEVERFENDFAAYCGCAHSIGVANGLDALELVLRAWDIGPGDEVIVPRNTFIATWIAVTLVGAKVVSIEADGFTHTIDAAAVEAAITPRTRAVIPVHLYGRPAPVDQIREVTDRYGLRLLEDAAQAHGASLRGKRVGSLGDAAAFSFYPAKNLGALGDGGAITTDDAKLAQQLRLLRNYGSGQRYVHTRIGRNSRLDELQAAFLNVKLQRLDADNQRRAQIAVLYSQALRDIPLLALPAIVPEYMEHVWHLYVVRHPHRDRLAERLAAAGIGTHVHYPRPPDLQEAYTDTALSTCVADRDPAVHRELLSLPIGPTMDDETVLYVAAQIRDALNDAP